MEKANILIVEDENIVAEDIKATLESLGYRVVGMASTGKGAIDSAEKLKPDLILMDIKLKGDMDGIEAAKKISDKFGTPIVFLTAYATESILDRAKRSNAFGYIVKPFEEKNLNSTIQMALQKHKEMEKMSINDTIIDLDAYDRKILYEMDQDARISASSIGNKLRLPKGTINYRINKLIENGYVNKFYTITNASLLGYQYYRIFMKFHSMTPQTEEEIIKFIKKEGNCLRLRITQGAFNLILFTIQKGTSDVKKFLENFNKSFGSYVLEKDVINITKSYKFNQKFLIESKDYKQVAIDHEKADRYNADETDMKILKVLSDDARIKLIDLSEKIDVDWKTIKYRIGRMEDKGVIVAYTTDLNLPKMDQQIIQIDINLKDFSKASSIIGFFNNTNMCAFAHEMMGKYDLSIELCIKSDKDLESALKEFQKEFSKSYVYFELSHIYRDYVLNPLV